MLQIIVQEFNMFRNKEVECVNNVLECLQTIRVKSKDTFENNNESLQKSHKVSVRNTTKILKLLQKSSKEKNEEIQKENISLKTGEDDAINAKINESTSSERDKIIFNVVLGKISTRKHKRWEDDGILEVTGKHAVLKDVEGNIIHRTTVNPNALVEGFRMYVDNKEVELIERTTISTCSMNPSRKEQVLELPMKKLKTSKFNSYLPFRSLHKGLTLRYQPPLIMPFLNISKDWTENHSCESEKEVSTDDCLVNVLRLHQRQGIVFLYECMMGLKVVNYFGAILADDMGLGKTLQCITIIWTLLKKGPYGRPILKNVLIVTPSSLCSNWNKEFKHWLGFHRISPYIVNAKNKPKDYKKQARNSVMIISYDMIVRCSEEMQEITFDLIVCDEGHRLKNNDTKAAKILNNLNCKRRIVLTGTPIQNNLQEFFTLINFVNPGILGNSYEFKTYYENPIVASQCPNASYDVISLGNERASELHEKTKCFILRRTQGTINSYLPSKHEIIVFCRLSKEQENLYSCVTDTWLNKSALSDNSLPHLSIITALKKIANHPELFYNDKTELLKNNFKNIIKNSNGKDVLKEAYSGKISIVESLMRSLKKTDEKLVLISYYTQTLDLLERVCNSEGLHFYRLDGNVASNTRTKIIEKFNSRSDNSKVFLLSAKAGGVGLNLPGASRLVLFDSDWNPASDAQAMARIWRDGQKKDVYILRLLTTGTIEEKIFQRQISKACLSETVVNLNCLASLKLSMDELKDLFTLTENTNCLTYDLMKCHCNGRKEVEEQPEQESDREYQISLKDKAVKSNLSINELLNWDHYQKPIPDKIVQEIMLSDVSENITFLFKNSTINTAK